MALSQAEAGALESAASAVLALQRAELSPVDRVHAQHLTESFKVSAPPHTLFHLLHARQAPPVRFFGLQALAQLVRSEEPPRWAALTVQQRAQIRHSTLQFAAHGLIHGLHEPTYVLNETVAVLVALAVRDWHPHGDAALGAWTTLADDLTTLVRAGHAHHRVIALDVWRTLAALVCGDAPRTISPARLAQLRGFLEKATPALLALVNESAAWATEQLRTGESEAAMRVMRATLACLAELLPWCALPAESPLTRWWAVLCELLGDRAMRYDALTCFDALYARKDAHETPRCFALLENVSLVERALTSTSPSRTLLASLNEDDYFFQQQLLRTLCDIARRFLRCRSQRKRQADAWPVYFEALVQLLLRCTQTPSAALTLIVLPFWVQLLKLALASDQTEAGWVEPVCGLLLHAIEGRMRRDVRTSRPEPPPPSATPRVLACFFLSLDCTTSHEATILQANLRTQLAALWASLARLFPVRCLELLDAKYAALVPIVQAVDAKHAGTPEDDELRTAVAEWKATGAELRAAVSAIPHAGAAGSQLLGRVLALQPCTQALIAAHVDTLASLVPKVTPSTLQFQHLLGAFLALAENAAPFIRLASSRALVGVCKAHAAILAVNASVLGVLSAPLRDGTALSKPVVMEALLAVGAKIEDATLRTELLQAVLKSLQAVWDGELSVATGGPLPLIRFLTNRTVGPQIFVKYVFDILLCSDSHVSAIRIEQAAIPLCSHHREASEYLLSHFMRVMSALHALWTAQARRHVPDTVYAVPSAVEKQVLHEDEASDDGRDEGVAVSEPDLCLLLERVRTRVYTALGIMLTDVTDLFYLPSGSQRLAEVLFSHWDVIEPRHLALLARTSLKPLVASFLVKYETSECQPVLRTFLDCMSNILRRLVSLWVSLGAHQERDERQAVLAETGLHDATHELCVLISRMIIHEKRPGNRGTADALAAAMDDVMQLADKSEQAVSSPITPLAAWLSANGGLTNLLNAVIAVLRSVSDARALLALLRTFTVLAPTLAERYSSIAPSLLSALLERLSLGMAGPEHTLVVNLLAALLECNVDWIYAALSAHGAKELDVLHRALSAASSAKARKNVLRGYIVDKLNLAPLHSNSQKKIAAVAGDRPTAWKAQEHDDDSNETSLRDLFS